ncbi:MAG: DUF615 domain-containing protein [Gammaproteobacteria bacterium]|nr:DUF615 domain-containing protein [Gammaproteobacteria bacterium]
MTEFDDEDIGPSKSQLKREAHAAQALGEALVKLKVSQLESLDLDEDLLRALKDAQKIKSYGALKRQIQYIGKIMRRLDVAAVEQRYQAFLQPHQQEVALFHEIETWRDRIIEQGDEAIQAFVQQYDQAQRQTLRQLRQKITSAKNDELANKWRRELFQTLKQFVIPA